MGRQLFRRVAIVALLLGLYPACVLGFTWTHVLKSDFKGGRLGQLDAYRHALASATVAYTLGEWAVHLTTTVFEFRGKDSNEMDIHNNQLGARLGSKTTSFAAIEPTIRRAVRNGRVSADDPNQITWLPVSRWREGGLW